MSEMKHTQGPWGAWNNRIFAGPFKVIEGGIAGFRAELCTLNEDGLSKKELADIARLIVAAPDLLEAAKEARIALHSCIDALDSQEQSDMDALTALDAAIAKAQGHTHD